MVFKIGKLFHLTQVVEDLAVADLWYNRIFAPCRFYRALMPEAFRDASLLAIGDLVVEPVQIAAGLPGVERSPLARFKARYGNRLHSIAWYVDSLEGAFETCRAQGVRMTDVTGRSVEDIDHVGAIKYFWTHPADTHGIVEFARLKPEFTIDPRVQPFWSSRYWRDRHPLGLTGRMTITTAVRDHDAAAGTYRRLMSGIEVPTAWADGRSAFQVGDDTIVELVPIDSPELGGFGEGVFGMAFHVADLAAAEAFLRGLGLPCRRAANGSIVLDPKDALGTTVGFEQAEERI